MTGYGYKSDEVNINNDVFGLTAGKTFLTKFEFITNGGKGGSEQDALDIVFTIDGKEKSYRKFPVTRVWIDNVESVDPNTKQFQDAVASVSQVLTHIAKCFVSEEDLQKAMDTSKPDSFKAFCQVLTGLLPANYKEIPLDIFQQWQWKIKEKNNSTFLEIPDNMRSGKWLCAAIPGSWSPVIDTNGLQYVNEAGVVHPFKRSVKFMSGNNAKRQTEAGSTQGTGTTNISNPMAGESKPSTSVEAKKNSW